MHGIGVSSGIAIGHAHLISHAALEVAHFSVPRKRIEGEIARFDAAIQSVQKELQALYSAGGTTRASAEFEAFLDLHQMILNDPTLSKAPRKIIEETQCNAEWALTQQMQVLLDEFDQIEDAYLRERRADVTQVVERVLKALMGHPGYVPPPAGRDSVLVAHDLSPADVISFKQYPLTAFVTDLGGATSHTAILARSLNLPSIVALHHGRTLIRENDLLIVDGSAGVVMVEPDEQVLDEYKLKQNEWRLEQQKLLRLRSAPAATLDGVKVELHANIELPDDLDQVKNSGATGIGLFRSEFLFLNRDGLPSEDEQFEAYRKVAKEMKSLPVTIRTLDLGGEKRIDGDLRVAPNPALGLRAVRYCLAEPQMFLTQLRAILRASAFGNIRILVPMLSNLTELRQVRQAVAEARRSLTAEKKRFDESIAIGGMVEIPAAALSIETFAKHLDFLSIGTNDLIQYTLAIDRTDDAVSHLYDPLHPAVLYLVAHSIHAADRAKIPISVCGEMAGDVLFTRLLLGFGLREFSMHPADLLAVKQQVLKANATRLAQLVNRLLRTADHEKFSEMVAKINMD
ncbi:MAG TPA: phosphoenolpyruvate--protein phosphotransferase [Burkholderiales bacterium]|nr:phosphoenolpyruvate--protein phosphotransferase [Burkholderiales bacterium]